MKVIEIPKEEDIAAVIQRIKSLKEREAVFDLPKGSILFANANNLRLMKKTAEVLGKNIEVETDDEVGRVMAHKAGIMVGDAVLKNMKPPKDMPRVIMPNPPQGIRSSTPQPFIRPRFSDINVRRPIQKPPPPILATAKPQIATPPPPPRPVPTSTVPKQRRSLFGFLRPLGSSFSRVFILVMVVLVIAVFAAAVLLPQASIVVYARSEPISRDLEITVDRRAQTTDVNQMTIPGVIVTKELSETKNFPATGSKLVGTKSAGEVTLYNFTKNTLTLRASTTTLVANGKKYFFTRDVTGLRPTAKIGSGNDQEVDPGTLIPPIPVVAENPGADFNIGPNTVFEVRNAALGNRPEVYGQNANPISGGSARNVTVVSAEDIEKATAAMTDVLAASAENELNVQASEDTKVRLLPSGLTKEILAKTANKNAGDEATDFDMTVIAKVSGLSYQEDDVSRIFVERINSVLSEDKYLLPDSEGDMVAKYKTLDLANGRGVLSVHFEAIAAYRVNDTNLSKVLAGKTATEIKEILLTKPEIDRVDVNFSPFFVNKAPRFNGKIKIDTKLSQN